MELNVSVSPESMASEEFHKKSSCWYVGLIIVASIVVVVPAEGEPGGSPAPEAETTTSQDAQEGGGPS